MAANLGTMKQFLAAAAFVVSLGRARAAGPDFQKEVRPILSANCFHCHGNDRTTRMVGLRLDVKEGLYSTRKAGPLIVPGKPERSLLYQRITAKEAARRMPPPQAHKTLKPEEIATIRRWIEAGAEWQEHWAFRAPARPALPEVARTDWVRNPVDRFVLARLEKLGLAPAPEAPRHALVRRLSYDLTGLPPDPEDVAAFVRSTDPEDDYLKLVEKYLASPHYGEHRARYWLDAARYGDTHGLHIDNYREMWPYRDWVIRAFNENMPFDRFTIEQLAGDLLPAPTLEQRIATGFQRCNVTTNEAGVIIEEVEAMYAKDRADTVGAVFLGLTVGCATCHDHKFDPISQRDFYALTAFFRNTTQHAMDGNIYDPPPIAIVPSAADRARWEEIEARERVLRSLLAPEQRRPRQEAELFRLDFPGRIRVVTQDGEAQMDFAPGQALGAGPDGGLALHLKGTALEAPGAPVLGNGQAFTVSAHFLFPAGEEGFTIAEQIEKIDEKKRRGWGFYVSARIPRVRFYTEDGKSYEIAAGHLDQLVPGTWNRVEFHYDGTGEPLGVRLWINGRESVTTRDAKAKFEAGFRANAPLTVGTPKRAEGGAFASLRIFRPVLSAEEEELLRLDLEKRAIRRRGAITHVMEERQDQKPYAHLLYRGMYDAPRDRLEANTPAVLPPMPASLPRNRLGLAQWLVSEENPLTARVTVNRFWQEIFGTGLVKTAEDFGSQGEPPANRELLDWLAVEFRESGWDVKKFFRLLVTSSAYRQAALATPEKLEKDPDNRLLSRGPRFRLDAEAIRDTALAASGLLVPAVGGPSVKPYQPDGIWEAVAMHGSDTRFYKRDSGDALYRRSLYTFWKRTAPPALLEIFNAPSREFCTVRRERTNTPLQALAVMNDVTFVEAARAMAARAMAEASGEARFQYMAQRLMSRMLEERELDIVRDAYRAFLRHYDSNLEDARKLIAQGESKPPENVSAAELAALTMVANQLMNLDEVLSK
jgi:mono/diheme cytochrome c family protein